MDIIIYYPESIMEYFVGIPPFNFLDMNNIYKSCISLTNYLSLLHHSQ